MIVIDQGADVNLADGDGQLPLRVASGFQSCRCVAALLAAGANPLAVSPYGITPLACMAGAPRTNPDGSLFACKGLCEEEISADRELQWKVMEEERARVARLLVSAGVDIHVRDSGGMTALGYAVKGKHEGVAAILEEFGGVV